MAEEGGNNWIVENPEELAEYNFQWIAVTAEGIKATSPSIDELVSLVVDENMQDFVTYYLVEFPEDGV